MKRYLVFGYDQYYPSGGWNDFKADFDTQEDAEEFAKDLVQTRHWDYYDVVDTYCKCIVADNTGYGSC